MYYEENSIPAQKSACAEELEVSGAASYANVEVLSDEILITYLR